MIDAPKPPPRRRRKLIIAFGVLLIAAALVSLTVRSWSNWASVDNRFVGKWSGLSEESIPPAMETFDLRADGFGVLTVDENPTPICWWVNADRFWIARNRGEPPAKTRLLSVFIETMTDRCVTFRIKQVGKRRILLRTEHKNDPTPTDLDLARIE